MPCPNARWRLSARSMSSASASAYVPPSRLAAARLMMTWAPAGIVADPPSLGVQNNPFQPIDLFEENAVGKLRRLLEIGPSFGDDDKRLAQRAAPLSAIHFSPKRLHNSPGAISSFHRANWG